MIAYTHTNKLNFLNNSHKPVKIHLQQINLQRIVTERQMRESDTNGTLKIKKYWLTGWGWGKWVEEKQPDLLLTDTRYRERMACTRFEPGLPIPL